MRKYVFFLMTTLGSVFIEVTSSELKTLWEKKKKNLYNENLNLALFFFLFFWLLLLLLLFSCFLWRLNFPLGNGKVVFLNQSSLCYFLFEICWNFFSGRMISFFLWGLMKEKLESQGSRLMDAKKRTNQCHSSRERKMALQQDVMLS